MQVRPLSGAPTSKEFPTVKVYETGSHVKKDDQNLTEASFGIGDAVTIFRLLRDKIYSDKITAVIREYVANAVDAHSAAGQSRAVDIYLPSFANQTFYVRDYGSGLSEEDVRDIYVMYGTSTKRSTNNEVGQLGLGCKSAFAYNDTFTVVSYQDGKAYTYTAYIDDSGVGKIRTMDISPTTEPSGVKVIIPVKASDVSWFVSKARDALCYYPQKFNVISGQTITYFDKKKQILHGVSGPAEWYITQNMEPTVVMGGIPYPLDAKQALDGSSVEPWAQGSCVIFVPIGAVDFAVSRELLEYTKRTKGFLKKAIAEITKDIAKNIEASLTSCKDLCSAKLTYSKLSSARLVSSVTPRWKGASLGPQITPSHPCLAYATNWEGPQLSQYSVQLGYNIEKVFFIEKNDAVTNWTGRLRAAVKDHMDKTVVVVYDPTKDVPDPKHPTKTFKTIKETYHLDLYKWLKIEDFEPIPAPPRPVNPYSSSYPASDYAKKNSHKYRAKAFLWLDGKSKGNIASSYWEKVDIDSTTVVKDRPYVIIESGFHLDYGMNWTDGSHLQDVLIALYSLVPSAKGPIYAFRAPIVVADLPPGLIPFKTWLDKQMTLVDMQLINDKQLYTTLVNTRKWNITSTISAFKGSIEKRLAPNSPFIPALHGWTRLSVSANLAKVNNVRSLGSLPTTVKPVDYEGILSRYPLVEVIAASATYFQPKDVAEQIGSYIAMMDDYLSPSLDGGAKEEQKEKD